MQMSSTETVLVGITYKDIPGLLPGESQVFLDGYVHTEHHTLKVNVFKSILIYTPAKHVVDLFIPLSPTTNIKL